MVGTSSARGDRQTVYYVARIIDVINVEMKIKKNAKTLKNVEKI